MEVAFRGCGRKDAVVAMKEVYSRHNGVLSDLDAMYSPGRRRNKYAMIIILLSAMMRGSPNAVAILEMWQITWRGVGLTHLGGGPCLL